MDTTPAPVLISYLLKFDDNSSKRFDLKFDGETFLFVDDSGETPPDWAKLEHKQCSHCPLKKEQDPYCPIARNLAGVAKEYGHLKSFREVQVLVQTSQRNYAKKVSLQEALYSIFGLIMATSSCPYMTFLRPLARYHLPFSNYDETITRTVGFYLLRQFNLQRKGAVTDYSLQGLADNYVKVNQLNADFLKRLRAVSPEDANLNSVAILDSFVQLLSFDAADGFSGLERYLPRGT